MRVPVKTSSASGTTGAEAVVEQIRTRAYELYEERGHEDGHEMDDWLQAEAEVTGKTRRAAA